MSKILPASESGSAGEAQASRKAAAAWGRRFLWHLCLYIGVPIPGWFPPSLALS